jgi:hypothetical protein
VQKREIDLGVDRVAHCSLYFPLSSIVRKSRNTKKTELFPIMLVNKKMLLELGVKISQFTSLSVIYTDSCTANLLLYIIAFETPKNRTVLLNMCIKKLETP